MNDRPPFFRFAGFSVEDGLSDTSTICRFRNTLLESSVYQKLLDRLNRQLEKKDLLIREGPWWMPARQIVQRSQIMEYIKSYNELWAKPFNWTYSGKPLMVLA